MTTHSETGAISAAGAISVPFRLHGPFNLTVTGTFAASAVFERSYDGGGSWYPFTYPDGAPLVLTGPCTMAFEESRMSVLGRVRALDYVSGELKWRVSRGM